METKIQQKPQDQASTKLTAEVIEGILDKKGQNITKLDLRHLDEAVCDYFIICQGSSTTQVKAIADNVMYQVKTELEELPLSFEGMKNSEWVLIDFVSVVVHVFLKDKREFYQLEDLWSDAITTNYTDDGKIVKET